MMNEAPAGHTGLSMNAPASQRVPLLNSVPGTKASIYVAWRSYPDGTVTCFNGSQGVSAENLQQVARECRRVLPEGYPDLVNLE